MQAAPGRKKKKNGKVKIGMTAYSALVLMMTLGTATVFAADDPIAVVNNLSTFIFGLIRAIGMILLGFGIVQIGLSLKSHDPSQRANGFLTLAGGVVITFAKEILNTIAG
ncbi:MAG: glutamyl-tRNA amidotransferase [Lachnospiraceae bacterium]|nr:glutamyl-tRNA amidotransferase [Lachnospiraceae bacterium]